MLSVSITPGVLASIKLPLEELLILIAVQENLSLNKAFTSLIQKGFIAKSFAPADNTGCFITDKGQDVLNQFLLHKDKETITHSYKNRIKALADSLIMIYPSGKKPGTPYYWRGNRTDVINKIDTFFRLYGTDYTDDEIITATQKYVKSFGNDYKYMQLLKYFIMKQSGGFEGGVTERASELANILSNPDVEVERLKEDWTSSLK